MSPRLPTLSQVAEQLNIGPRKLIANLKLRKIIDADNYAKSEYVKLGYFKIEQRRYTDKNSLKERNYFVTTVTDDGLFFLQSIAHELRGATRLHGSDGADRATAEREFNSIPSADRPGSVCGVQP